MKSLTESILDSQDDIMDQAETYFQKVITFNKFVDDMEKYLYDRISAYNLNGTYTITDDRVGRADDDYWQLPKGTKYCWKDYVFSCDDRTKLHQLAEDMIKWVKKRQAAANKEQKLIRFIKDRGDGKYKFSIYGDMIPGYRLSSKPYIVQIEDESNVPYAPNDPRCTITFTKLI